MSGNIEIKARVGRLEEVRAKAIAIGAAGPQVLEQTDTFYRCLHGRMKLRECDGHPAELIIYTRPDTPAPKQSEYVRLAVPDVRQVRDLLASTHGVVGVVRKRREVFMWGQVRIHLDEVEGLGSFMELEAVLDAMPEAEARIAVDRLMQQLGIKEPDLVSTAYLDLLAGEPSASAPSR